MCTNIKKRPSTLQMPAKPAWMLMIPNIIEQLQKLEAPVLDRAVFERLFQVKRRRAIQLMQHFGGFRSGHTVLVDRSALMADLQQLGKTDDCLRERRRKQRLSANLDELHRHCTAARIRLPVSPGAQHRTAGNLPTGISLEPGKLTVQFSAPEELFAKLYELGQAAANDYETVCEAMVQGNC